MDPMIVKIHDAVKNVNGLIDELSYRNYKHNRINAPHLSAEVWRNVYVNAEKFEERFKMEQENVNTDIKQS